MSRKQTKPSKCAAQSNPSVRRPVVQNVTPGAQLVFTVTVRSSYADAVEHYERQGLSLPPWLLN